MLRFLAFSPLIAAGAPRALADGSSGTLGAGVVGSHELRRGAVTLDRIADLEPGRILGRGAESGTGAPEALDIQGLRSLLGAGESEMIGLTSLELEQMRPEAGTLALRSLGVYAPGDGGHALWRAAPGEPEHPGKLRTADGRWWELDPEQMISPRMFGALGDGQFNDTSAFDAGVAYCRHMRVPLRIPAGTFVLNSLSAIIRDVTGGPTVPRDEVIIRGAGRTATHLVFSKDLTAPFLKCTPSQNVKLGAVELTDLTIDGRGFAGTVIKLSHMSKCHFARLRITDVRGMAFDCAELWDSMFHDVLIEGVGDYAAGLPSLRLRDRDLSDHNSSCNNLGFYDLHIENHPFRGLEILDTSRKLTFVRLKCHHTPGNFPPSGTDHVVLDSRGIASGGGYMITFLGIHLAVSSGSGIALDDSSATPRLGFSSVAVLGGSIQAQSRYAIRARRCGTLTLTGAALRNNGTAAIYVHADCRGVQPDWATLDVQDNEPIRYAGPNYVDPLSQAAEVQGGRVSAVGTAMTLDTAGQQPTATLERIEGGGHGRTLALSCLKDTRRIVVRQSGTGNIRTAGGADRTLAHPDDTLLLRYDAPRGVWVEAAFTRGA